MKKNSVLIVEDSHSFASLLADMLNDEADFTVSGIANDGFQALDYIKESNPDIVILDIIMPKLDGLGVIENINKLVSSGEIEKKPKILVLSAVAQDNIAKNVMDLGADYCMLKPFDLTSFLARLRSFSAGDSPYMPEENNIQTLNNMISSMLQSAGVPLHIKGFRYMNEAALLLYLKPEHSNKITSVVYPLIAAKYETTSTSIEKAIRNAIELTLGRKFFDETHPVLGELLRKREGKVSNSEFIMNIVEWLKKEQ